MKFQQKVNGTIIGESDDKEVSIKAARKAALSISNPRGLIHVEVFKVDAEGDVENVHRDLVLAEDVQELKTDSLKSIGLITSTKHVEQKTKNIDTRPLYNLDDYVILDSELHQIIMVSDGRAMAQPLRKKTTHIKNKFADKPDRVFSVRRKPIQISPYAENVLTADEVKKELKKLKELDNVQLNDSSEDSGLVSAEQSRGVVEDGGNGSDNGHAISTPKKVKRK